MDHKTPVYANEMVKQSQQASWERLASIVKYHTPAIVLPSYRSLIMKRLLAENVLLLLLQYTGLMLSSLATPFSPVWLAAGTGLAFCFLRGCRILPGVYLGSFAAYYSAGLHTTAASGCAMIYTLQTFLLWYLCQQFISPTLLFYRIKHCLFFLGITWSVTAMASLLLVICCASARIPPTSLPAWWLSWWIADINGILLLSCAIVTWDAYFPQWTSLHWPSLYLHFGSFFILLTAVVITNNSMVSLLLLAGASMALLWISMHFGWCGSMAALALSGLLFSLSSYMHYLGRMPMGIPLLLCLPSTVALLIASQRHQNAY